MEFGLQSFLRLAGSLALVLGIFYLAIYGIKRWGHLVKKTPPQPMLEVLSKHSFGPRHHLVLIQVPGGQRLLVGISPQNMHIVATAQPSGGQAEKIETE